MNNINYNQITANRLVTQYKEYLAVQDRLNNLKNQKLQTAAETAKTTNSSLATVLIQTETYGELKKIEEFIKLSQKQLDRLSDEMSFPNHIVWMMYKDFAYKGTSAEISNLKEFRQHCSPEGYICTKRFKFLSDYLLLNNCDLQDIIRFPDELSLSDFYQLPQMQSLLEDYEFLQRWQSYEYFIDKNKIAKWANFGL